MPSVANTQNAAICLDELGRYDEALELYEDLITRFREEISEEDRAAVAPDMQRLRGQVGSIDVLANVGQAAIVIDGRARGRLPLVSPIRVMPGRHDVRVLKEGYETFQSTVEVAVGKTASVDARLKPLANAGRLRIEHPVLAGAEVFVDGVLLGRIPWEGTLGAGRHLFLVRKGNVGSAPKEVIVVEGQTALPSVQAHRLGPALRIRVEPATAELSIDGVPVGKGRWEGRLPVGEHRLEARESGYFNEARGLKVTAESGGDTVLRLRAQAEHPRWGTKEPGLIWLEAFGGVAIASSFGSQAEESCESGSCSENSAAWGALVGARAGYEFPFGLSVQAAGGYLTLGQELGRELGTSFEDSKTDKPVPVTYTLSDDIRISGALAGVGLSYRQPLGEHVELRIHALVGALFARSRDAITGTVSDGARTLDVYVNGSDTSVGSVDLFVMPELQLGLRFAGFAAGLGLSAPLFLLEGPAYETGDVSVVGSCSGPSAPALACAPGSELVAGERAYGLFLAWVPTASAGYSF
ncbi:MAG: PEGA domain-containing protein [Deltaproteobacteria bacterium]|nr:PEGA domain-containing protein [Deltaproteobacteria bacterium]